MNGRRIIVSGICHYLTMHADQRFLIHEVTTSFYSEEKSNLIARDERSIT